MPNKSLTQITQIKVFKKLGSTPNCVGFEPIKKSQPQITLIYTNLFNPKIARILLKFVTQRSQPVCRHAGWLMKQLQDPMRIGEAIYTNPFNSKNILILIKFV